MHDWRQRATVDRCARLECYGPRPMLRTLGVSILVCALAGCDSAGGDKPSADGDPSNAPPPTFEVTRAVIEHSNPSIESNPTTNYSIGAEQSDAANKLLQAAVTDTKVNGVPLAKAIAAKRAKDLVTLAAISASAPKRPDPGTGGGITELTLYDAAGPLFVDTSLDDFVLEGKGIDALVDYLHEHGTRSSSGGDMDVRRPIDAPSDEPVENPATEPEPQVFELGPLVSGRFTPVATLTFDAEQHGTLEVSSGDQAELEEAWKAIEKLDEVSFKRDKRTPEGRALVSHTEKRGHEKFPHAMAERLAQDAGMFAVPK